MPFFSIYSKAAEDEDNKMVKKWQKDAEGILIFVSLPVSVYMSLWYELELHRPVYSRPQSLCFLL